MPPEGANAIANLKFQFFGKKKPLWKDHYPAKEQTAKK